MNNTKVIQGKDYTCAYDEVVFVSKDTPQAFQGDKFVCPAHTCEVFDCASCCEQFFDSEAHIVDGTRWCNRCTDNDSFYCDNCDDRYSGNDYYSVGDHTVCDSCYSDNYNACEDCGNSYDNDDLHYCDDCENDYCRGCYDDHTHDSDECDRLYQRQVHKEVFLTGTTGGIYIPAHLNRYVGVEIEAEHGEKGKLEAELPSLVGITGDGSLSSSGIEVQTLPASLDMLEAHIHDVCKVLSSHGYKGTKACGLHVHIDVRDIADNQQKIMHVLKTFYAVEDLLYSMLPSSRWSKQFCKRLSKDYLYNTFNKDLASTDFEKKWYKETSVSSIENRKKSRYDNSRYYGLNIHSIFYRGTIELRYHSGTTNPIKILNWIVIVMSILDYAINRYDEKEVACLFDEMTGYNKFSLFASTMQLPSGSKMYMQSRIDKFNHNYSVRFNKGAAMRKIERMNKGKKIKKLNKEKEILRDKIRREEAVRWEGTGLMLDASFEQKVDRLVVEAISWDSKYTNILALEQEESGFLKETELDQVRTYITMGRNQANQQEVNGDEE